MDQFYIAISLYRHRKYDECIVECNKLLQKDATNQGPWELKMRAVTQRVYIDDIEADDGVADEINEEKDARGMTAGKIKTAGITTGVTRPITSTGRPLTGMYRPGTVNQRPGSSMRPRTSIRPSTGRSSTARNIRVGTANMFAFADPNGPLIHTSRLNPEHYVKRDREYQSKSLFQYLYYHEGDVQRACDLCVAIVTYRKEQTEWWWNTQLGRCYIALGKHRKAEEPLTASLSSFPHPDTALLLSRIYVKIEQPDMALQTLSDSLKRMPDDVSLLTQQARIFEQMTNLQASARMYRIVAQVEPINVEALANIAVHHFYGQQPEMALVFYRRILSMGAHTCEIYCNIGLCCLYSNQIDLVLPCFQRALQMAESKEQIADTWYNISFVAINSGEFSLARRCLRLCISFDGTHGAALNNLSVLEYQSGHETKAKSYMAAAKNTLPNQEEILYNCDFLQKMEIKDEEPE